jgi:Zn-dependent protease
VALSAGVVQGVSWVAVVETVPVVVAAIVFHEVAHGAVAYICGDPTAARAGRLTLNPLPHVDPFGTIILPGLLLLTPLLFGGRPFVFGWAKPVPVDYRQLRHPRRDAVLVALAGPGTNLVLATLSAFALAALPAHGSLAAMAEASLYINCVLAVFNLLPVPPLDGSRILSALLPAPAARALGGLERVGFVILLLLMLNTNILWRLVRPVIGFFLQLAG